MGRQVRIDDDVAAEVEADAESRHVSLSRAATDALRRAYGIDGAAPQGRSQGVSRGARVTAPPARVLLRPRRGATAGR